MSSADDSATVTVDWRGSRLVVTLAGEIDRANAAAVGDALASASKATDLIRAAYERGALSYLELLDAERTRLQAELQTARIAAQRHLATVRLIKALGGGW